MADRDGRLLRQAHLLTEEGRVRERLRIAGRLQARLAAIQDRRLDLYPEMPAAYLPARNAVRRAGRVLKEAAAAMAEPVALPAAKAPRLRDRIARRFSSPSTPQPRSVADPAEARRASRHEAYEKAERHLAEAKRELAGIETRHARASAATEADRMARLARLDRRTALADAALHLLAGDEDWTSRGPFALMRAARQALQLRSQDIVPIEESNPADEPSAIGPRLR